jgi:hypothetical protein
MRTETKIIGIYTFDELSEEAKQNVIDWLNQAPVQYETDEGWEYQYYDELDDEDIAEHCEMNGYEFLEDGTTY